MYFVDILGGHPLPKCPYKGSYLPPNDTSSSKYHNPAVSSTYFFFLVLLLILGVATVHKYNYVKIFNRTINHPSITNQEYILFYVFAGVSFGIDGIRYALNLPFKQPEEKLQGDQWVVGDYVIDSWLLVGSSLLRSIALMCLTLALNQQRLHRSTAVVVENSESEPLLRSQTNRSRSFPGAGSHLFEDVEPLPQPNQREESTEPKSWSQNIKEVILSMKSIIGFIFISRLAILLLAIDLNRLGDVVGSKDSLAYPISQTIGSLIQLSPLFYLVLVIIKTPSLPLQRSSRISGPSLTSKIILLLSIFASLIFWFEPSLVHRIFEYLYGPSNESRCIVFPYWWVDREVSIRKVLPAHGWASTIDLIQWIGGFGLYGIFYFMKQEFTRNMEDWIWVTVSEVQNTFDFRRY